MYYNTYYDGVDLITGILGSVWSFGLIFQIVCYVFQALALYTIAKRRGIRNYGLAWVPIANFWILGSISDQYKYVSTGAVQGRRKILFWLNLILSASSLILVVTTISRLVGFAVAGVDFLEAILGLAGSLALLSLALAVVSIVWMVFYFISLYNVYASCMPGNATVFLVLSIFFSVTTPFFLFACRNRDDGMPPRHGVDSTENTYFNEEKPWNNE